MHAQRFNPFSMIHKALRNMLYDAASDLQRANLADPVTTLPALEKVHLVLELFDDHADHEDTLVLPMIHNIDRPLVDAFESEHVTDRNLCSSLNNSIEAYKGATTDAERITAGHEVFYAFNEFIAFNLQHMNREETRLNNVLWSNYNDGDIMAVNQKIAASIPTEKAAINITWMLRSCNMAEISNFFKGLKANAPEPLFNMVMGLAQRELSQSNLAMLKESLDQFVMS